MDQYEFEQYLRKHSKSASKATVGRYYLNAFGQKEIIVLPQSYWNYADWLEETQGSDIQGWVTACDQNREEKTLSESLMEWFYWDECDRHRNGLETPTDTPPIGYVE